MPQITLPTRLSDTCDTFIDNTLTNYYENTHTSGVLSMPISDHQMTFTSLVGTTLQATNKQLIEFEKVNDRAIENFKADLASCNIYDRMNHNLEHNPNTNYDILSDILTELKVKHMPKKIRKFNKRKDKKEKWMTDDLLRQINTKNDLYVDWKKSSNDIDSYNIKKSNFKAFERIVTRNINEAKRSYYHETFKHFQNDIKNTWKTINDTLGRHKKESKMPNSMVYKNDTISDPIEIANAFNDYFINVGTNITLSNNDSNTFNQKAYQKYLHTPSDTQCKFVRITEMDVLQLINKMDNKSSSGHDGISNRILKSIKNIICKPIALIINQMIETGVFPTSLKIAKTIPLYKKGDPHMPSNYRPISLLPTISKIFERVIYNQLYDHFIKNNLLSEQQYGFRANHSTELAAIRLVDHINHEMDKNHTPCSIYIDLSKAFDTLDFEILLFKLRFYGVTDTAFELMKNYLSDRKQYVKYNVHESDVMAIKTGVPQGSILGPLLFSICINDLVTVSNKLNFLMYADDTTIYFNLEDFSRDDVVNCVSIELNKVNNWLHENKLSLNVEKTKCMIFHRHQKKIEPMSFSINEVQIDNVSSFKFLGIMLNEHLTWKAHANMITIKLSKVVGIINKLKYVYPESALMTLYTSLFLSHINYGLLLWGTDIAKAFLLQKKMIRFITGSEYRAHSEPLFKASELLTIPDLFNLKLLKFYYKLSYQFLPKYFNGYLDVIRADVPYNYTLRQAARPLIRLPRVRHVFAQSTVLYQLIKLINETHNKNPKILEKIDQKSHTLQGFSFNVTQIYLQNYNFECSLQNCFICNL